MLPVLLLPAAFFHVLQWDSNALTKLFPDVQREATYVADFIERNTGYSDVVFSLGFSVPASPPQQLALTMKRIYRVAGTDQIKQKVENIKEPFAVNIFLQGQDLRHTALWQLTSLRPRIIREGKYVLYKIEGRKFLQNF